jgi:hypothetical protein
MIFAWRKLERSIGRGSSIRRVPRLVSDAMSVEAKTVEKIGIIEVLTRFRFAAR